MGKIRCLECGKILESKSVHDFQGCGCSNESFVDGGNEYTRIGGKDLHKIAVIMPDGTERPALGDIHESNAT